MAAPTATILGLPDPRPVAETMAMSPAPLATQTLPRLTLEEVASSAEPMGLFAVDGALVVSERDRVGRIVGDTVHWFAKLPQPTQAFGAHRTMWIQGRWPHRLDVVRRTTNPVAPLPTYAPLTGPGKIHRPDPATANAYFAGVATVGASTLVLTTSTLPDGTGIVTVRGPELPHRQQTGGEAGCTPTEHIRRQMLTHLPDLVPRLFGATEGGTVVAVGALCETRAAGAEIWDETGVSRIVDLSHLLTGFVRPRRGAQMLVGKDDDLWIFVDGFHPVLHFRAGRFEALPMLSRRIDQVFLSETGQLHASDGRAIHRLGESGWTAIAHFAEHTPFDHMAVRRGVIWGQRDGGLYRLRRGARAEASLGCPHPWVYVGDHLNMGPTLEKREPAVAAALRAFPDGLTLPVNELPQRHDERVGIRVPNRSVGAALVEHLKAEISGFQPTLTCLVPIPDPDVHQVKPQH